ncbi:MAG: invasion associated locus B family protein [Cognatishimia sp.]|uniref:invasion associated locus B family protein n=1 Tax=Cognatishimia sp. TaxID=2211648 RepID=UPI003B8E5AF6
MLGPIKKLALAAVFTVPTVAFAQDTATDTTEAPSDLATGQPVAPEVVSETFGDWTVNCQQLPEGERCQMQQLLLNSQETPAVEVNLFPVTGQSQVFAGGTIIAPLGTLLPAQLTISIDGALGKAYPFAFCLPDGCVSRVGLTKEDVTGLKKGAEAEVTLAHMSAPGQPINIKMSLSGFTKAFERMSQ